jgi:hypothetical protein
MNFFQRLFGKREYLAETRTITIPCDCSVCGDYNREMRTAENHGQPTHNIRVRWDAHCYRQHGGRNG